MMQSSSYKHISVLLLLFFAVTGCANGIKNSKPVILTKKEQLEKRISEYIEIKKTDAVDKEYFFMPPSFQEAVSLEEFKKYPRKKYDKFEIAEIKYKPDEDHAWLRVKTDIFAMGRFLKDFIISQCWVYVDGDWYVFAKPQKSMNDMNATCSPKSL